MKKSTMYRAIFYMAGLLVLAFGIVQAIADFVRKPVGITKNCFDLFDVCLTAVICLAAGHKVIGIGLGTVLAVLGVGRVIALFNHLFMKKMDALAGLEC